MDIDPTNYEEYELSGGPKDGQRGMVLKSLVVIRHPVDGRTGPPNHVYHRCWVETEPGWVVTVRTASGAAKFEYGGSA